MGGGERKVNVNVNRKTREHLSACLVDGGGKAKEGMNELHTISCSYMSLSIPLIFNCLEG